MTDDRIYSGQSRPQSNPPTPFRGRSARGYGSGSTTVFVSKNAAQSNAARPQNDADSFDKAVFFAAAPPSVTAASHSAPPQNGTDAHRRNPSSNVQSPYAASRRAEAVNKPAEPIAEHISEMPGEEPSMNGRQKKTAGKGSSGKTGETTAHTSKNSVKTEKAGGEKPKKKKKGLFIFLAVLLALVLVVAGTGTGAGLYVLKDYENEELRANVHVTENKLKSSPGVRNILLMGIDTEDSSASTRSDAMVLISIDSVHKKIKLTSFLRDMYVKVPGHGETKLTHACSYKDGGPQLTRDSIELNFGVKIDGYAKIGYDIFRDVIDAVGGITVAKINQTEAKALRNEHVDIEPGENIHLDGKQALAYCRIRYGQTDFQRTERQRETIMLVLDKMKKMNPIKLLNLAASVASRINCSLPKSELITLAFKVIPCLLGSVEQTQIPTDGAWNYGTRGGMSVILVNFEKNREFLSEWIYGK